MHRQAFPNKKLCPWTDIVVKLHLGSGEANKHIEHEKYFSCSMTKLTEWLVCTPKTQISLGTCPLWSVIIVHIRGHLGPKPYSDEQWRLWSETGWIPRMIWSLPRRKDHLVGFVVLRLISAFLDKWWAHKTSEVDGLWHWLFPLQVPTDFFKNNIVPDQQLVQHQQFNKPFYTVNFLNIQTPKIFVVITLKFELCGSTIE